MRGIAQNDIEAYATTSNALNWPSDNKASTADASGNTWKLSDTEINLFTGNIGASGTARIWVQDVTGSSQRFYRDCEYDHLAASAGGCAIAFTDVDMTSSGGCSGSGTSEGHNGVGCPNGKSWRRMCACVLRLCAVGLRATYLTLRAARGHVVFTCANRCWPHAGVCTHSNVKDGRGWYFNEGCVNAQTGNRDMNFYVRVAGTASMSALLRRRLPLSRMRQQRVENVCTCPNGVGTFADACPSDGASMCASCSAGFTMNAAATACEGRAFMDVYVHADSAPF